VGKRKREQRFEHKGGGFRNAVIKKRGFGRGSEGKEIIAGNVLLLTKGVGEERSRKVRCSEGGRRGGGAAWVRG